MAVSASQALTTARSRVGRSSSPGMCLQVVRSWYGIPAGPADAAAAWAHALGKHTGTPPPGAPVFWTGGSAGHGHIAIADSGGYIIGTDTPTRGRVGRVPLRWVADHWGLRYVGWAEGWNGHRIPGLPPAARVNLSQLHYGQRGSDSVVQLQRALNAHLRLSLPLSGNYLDQTDAAVRRCQQAHGYGSDPARKSFVGPSQARHLGLAT